MRVNIHLNLDPRDAQARELIELLKAIAETEVGRRRRSYHPLDWLSGFIRKKVDKWTAKAGAGEKIPSGRSAVKA